MARSYVCIFFLSLRLIILIFLVEEALWTVRPPQKSIIAISLKKKMARVSKLEYFGKMLFSYRWVRRKSLWMVSLRKIVSRNSGIWRNIMCYVCMCYEEIVTCINFNGCLKMMFCWWCLIRNNTKLLDNYIDENEKLMHRYGTVSLALGLAIK